MVFHIIVSNIINIVLVLVSIHQMYHGIEISHPIYCILFSNLVSALFASLSDIIILTLESGLTTPIIVKASAVFMILFHHWSWCIISFLRYLYIVQRNWLHEKFPEPWKITIIAMVAVYTLFFATALTNVFVLTYNGWPFVEMYDMERPSRIACTLTLFLNYILPMSISCYFYILLLRYRGVVANIVGVGDMPNCQKENIPEVKFK